VPSVSTINISQSSIVQGNAATFSATLKANLPSGYTVKINYGNGLTKMNGSGKSFNLTATPTSLGSGLFTVGIYDSKNVLKSNQLTGNLAVVEPTPVVIVTPEPTPVVTTGGDVKTFVSGSKTFSYTKIANDGSALPKTAKLGTAPKDWACTKDNNTGLIWEVKTDDGGLRDWKNYYSWLNPDSNTNGGYAGYANGYSDNKEHPEWCRDSNCDTYAFTNAVNKEGLCGAKDWRMPNFAELQGLLTMQLSTVNQPRNDKLYIDSIYFPNTNYWYWSSSSYVYDGRYAWHAASHFSYGGSSYGDKNGQACIRLVRGEQ
jgi:hypothetical protein